jgi:hypothetical protein
VFEGGERLVALLLKRLAPEGARLGQAALRVEAGQVG